MPYTHLRRFWSIARWVLLALFIGYAALVAYRMFALREESASRIAVADIEARRITQADVDGTKLPPQPDSAKNNATLAGIDSNQNGIRDDVERAIFEEYPTSSPTSTAIRAAELQYAMDLQIQLIEVVDSSTWKAAVQQWDRGFGCLYEVSTNYSDLEQEIDTLVLNTESREKQLESLEEYKTAHKLPPDPDCDITS